MHTKINVQLSPDMHSLTCTENTIAVMLNARVKGEKIPHKVAVSRDKLMKSFGVYSYFGG